jgi:hypothetical protein
VAKQPKPAQWVDYRLIRMSGLGWGLWFTRPSMDSHIGGIPRVRDIAAQTWRYSMKILVKALTTLGAAAAVVTGAASAADASTAAPSTAVRATTVAPAADAPAWYDDDSDCPDYWYPGCGWDRSWHHYRR